VEAVLNKYKEAIESCSKCSQDIGVNGALLLPIVDTFLEASITSKDLAAVLSGQARTVRGTGPDGP
jgi:hypothetical protein